MDVDDRHRHGRPDRKFAALVLDRPLTRDARECCGHAVEEADRFANAAAEVGEFFELDPFYRGGRRGERAPKFGLQLLEDFRLIQDVEDGVCKSLGGGH